MKKLIVAAVSVILAAAILAACKLISPGNAVVVYPQEAGPLEEFAARELQRYLYLRTGILADLVRSDSAPAEYGHCFILGNKNRKLFRGLADSADIGRYSENLGEDGFFIKSYTTPHGRQHVIAGGDERGTLYGAYRLLESTGLRYGIDGDVLPDEKFDPDLLSL
ncbi:MAG: alpha-glucuronidase family glycosyl hydrolase, partial [Bacteroidia bacterium]|nr:alpha-glucuronidase family glycosyl hydrolase [Bacteroidia bacterium]